MFRFCDNVVVTTIQIPVHKTETKTTEKVLESVINFGK